MILIEATENQVIKAEKVALDWLLESNILVCRNVVLEALIEFQLNKEGFTKNEKKAKYPKR